MAIVKWQDPFGIIRSSNWPLVDDDDFWSEDKQGLSMYETDNEVIVKAAVPGVPSDKVDISIESGTLTVKAQYEETDEEKKKKKVVYRESRAAKYYYTAAIPTAVMEDKAEAKVENGVVIITLPKKEEAKPKKIKVKAQ